MAWTTTGTSSPISPAYDRFTRAWLTECHRLLRKDGTLWVIGAYHNIFRIGAILQDMGFWILNDVIWRKSNPMPNFRGRRFTNAHETLIWAARGRDSRYKFNYQAMKALNDDIQMRSDWLIPLCTGPERLRNQHGLKLHPTQKPEALLHRVLLASTGHDDIVLDPFAGTGTTAVVARRLGRHFIAIERHPAYVEAAWGRLRRTRPRLRRRHRDDPDETGRAAHSVRQSGRAGTGPARHANCSTGSGGLPPWSARTARSSPGDTRGSIHKVGAALQNAPSCNGWTFWHVERDGTLVPLDHLRASALAGAATARWTWDTGPPAVRDRCAWQPCRKAWTPTNSARMTLHGTRCMTHGLVRSIDPRFMLSGFFVGMLVGQTGMGGGSLMTPILVLFFGIHPATAVGTDLLYASATKTVGTLVHGLNRTVDWRIVARLALGSVPATLLTLAVISHFNIIGPHQRPDHRAGAGHDAAADRACR